MKHDLRVDFLERRRPAPLGLALAVLGLAVLTWQALLTRDDHDALQSQRAGLASLQRPRGDTRPAMTARDVERHAQMEEVAVSLAAPWPVLLDLLEKHARSGVVLLKLRPDAATGHLELTARAPSAEVLGAYLVALEAEEQLRNVAISRHEVLQEAAGRGVEFTVAADWRRATTPSVTPSMTPSTPVARLGPLAAAEAASAPVGRP
jgi:Tfp pilus assembly protein PilN